MPRTSKITDENYHNSFCENLRKMISERNVKLPELAKNIGISYQAVQQHRDGLTVPTLLVAQKYADYFNVSLDYLSGRIEDPRIYHSSVDDVGISVEAAQRLEEWHTNRKDLIKILSFFISDLQFERALNRISASIRINEYLSSEDSDSVMFCYDKELEKGMSLQNELKDSGKLTSELENYLDFKFGLSPYDVEELYLNTASTEITMSAKSAARNIVLEDIEDM